MTDEIDWSHWFHRFLRELKLAYHRLSIDGRAQIVTSSGMGEHRRGLPFSKPTQLLVVWVRDNEQQKDYQLVQIEHFEDRPDQEVAVYGPFALEDYSDVVTSVLQDPRWKNETHHDHAFVKALEDRLVTAHAYIRAAFGRDSSTMDLSGQLYMRWYPSDIAFASFRDLRNTEPAELVAELVKSTLGTSVPESAGRPRFHYNAVGTYGYQPFWIEAQPELTFAERLRGQKPRAAPDKGWRIPFVDTHILAWQNGFLAVEGEPDRALDGLNTLLAVMHLLGVAMDPVTPHSVIRVEVDPNTFRISAINRGGGDSWVSGGWMTPPEPGPGRMGVLPLAAVTRAALISQRILADSDLASLAVRHAQAEALAGFLRQDTAAFLFAWNVLERWLYRQLDRMSLSHERLKKLRNWNSVDAVLEILEVSNQVSTADYRRLMHWKIVRNRVVHAGQIVAQQESREILNFSGDALRNEIGIRPSDAVTLEPLRN